MPNTTTEEHLDIIEANWGERLGKHSYNTVEKDENGGSTEDIYKTELKRLGLVAFWKVPGKDGVLVSHTEYSLNGSKSIRQKVGLVGEAQQYFKQNDLQYQAVGEKVNVAGQEIECIDVDVGKFWDVVNKA